MLQKISEQLSLGVEDWWELLYAGVFCPNEEVDVLCSICDDLRWVFWIDLHPRLISGTKRLG